MANILKVITAPNPILNQKSEYVEIIDDGIRTLTENMLQTMYKEGGIGLAAVQVAVLKKIIVIDIDKTIKESGSEKDFVHGGKPLVIINPNIIWKSEEIFSDFEEGCLSIPGIGTKVERAREVLVSYLDTSSIKQEIHAKDLLLSICLQHEIDHTDGILTIDYMPRIKYERTIKKLITHKKRTKV